MQAVFGLDWVPTGRLRDPAALGVFAGILLCACGGTGGRLITGSQPPSTLLQAWAGFPIHASPRPIVLAGSPVLGPSKFPNGQAKLDYIDGVFRLEAPLPSGPATSDGYPVVGARAALALLRAQSHPSASPTSSGGTAGLAIIGARLGTGTFATDRGDRTLPAWLFSLANVEGAVAALAVSSKAQWFPPGTPAPATGGGFVNGASVAPDGRTLTAGFTGAPAGEGPCTSRYGLTLSESPTAVVVIVTEYSHSSPTTLCPAVGRSRTATAVLASPLGGRVVLDAVSGQPMPVTGGI